MGVCRSIKMYFKCTHIKLILICLFFGLVYLGFSKTTFTSETTKSPKFNQKTFNAYILTENCASDKYNITKTNIELAFPKLFSFFCYPLVPLSDPRIHVVPLNQLKVDSANLITFLELWTYKIPETSKTDEYEWSFIFEDDVNFIDANSMSLPNFIAPLQQLMTNREVQHKHGFFYLGLCRASFDEDSQSLTFNITTNQIHTRKGCGFCRYATAITNKRAELFWTEISTYRSNIEGAIDVLLYDYCLRSGEHFYTLGANFQNSSKPGQTGIAFKNGA